MFRTPCERSLMKYIPFHSSSSLIPSFCWNYFSSSWARGGIVLGNLGRIWGFHNLKWFDWIIKTIITLSWFSLTWGGDIGSSDCVIERNWLRLVASSGHWQWAGSREIWSVVEPGAWCYLVPGSDCGSHCQFTASTSHYMGYGRHRDCPQCQGQGLGQIRGWRRWCVNLNSINQANVIHGGQSGIYRGTKLSKLWLTAELQMKYVTLWLVNHIHVVFCFGLRLPFLLLVTSVEYTTVHHTRWTGGVCVMCISIVTHSAVII